MWPFSRRNNAEKKKGSHLMRKVVVGLVIGGAVGSIVGKKIMQHHCKRDEDNEETPAPKADDRFED